MIKRNLNTETIKRGLLAVLLVIASGTMLCGITAAWFCNQYRLSTIGRIHTPTYISILAPGDTSIQSIDLSYDKSEVHNGRVELKRPFVIRSESQYYDLCIAHTTNISGLKISLYEAEANGSQGNAYLAGITEKGTPYYWNQKTGTDLFTEGRYLNPLKNQSAPLADPGHAAHGETFRLTEDTAYSNVQKNAEPLYWVRKTFEGSKRAPEDKYYYTNYILEITWNETDKETDMMYVIAQTSDGNNNQGT